nr:sulfonate ABC transporter substrate-binding protein [Paraburkholderia sp.]
MQMLAQTPLRAFFKGLYRWRRAAGLAVALAVSTGVHAGPVVDIGYQKGTPLTLLKARGTLERALAQKGYAVRWTEFAAGPPLLEAMNAGAIDIGYTGSPPPIFAQAAGSRLVYLAAEPAGPQNEALIVRAGSPLKRVADLKGRTVALARGSSSHYLLVAALAQAGLRYEDVKVVFLSPADARAAFDSGHVDAWAIWDPYLAVVQQAEPTRTLADYGSGIAQPYSFFLGAPDFVKAHRDVVATVLQAVKEGDAWVLAHRDETTQLIARETGVPPPVVAYFLARSRFGVLPLDNAILASQQRVADVFFAQKLIPHAVNVAQAAVPVAVPGAALANTRP